jgi:hypothetical protein
VVVGAGYIGAEAADALRRNGLRVTILERSTNALMRDDAEFAGVVRKQLERHGWNSHRRDGDGDRARSCPGCRDMVMAAGFQPNAGDRHGGGIEINERRFGTDERMETNLRGVFAAAIVPRLPTCGQAARIPLALRRTRRAAWRGLCGGRRRASRDRRDADREHLRRGVRYHRVFGCRGAGRKASHCDGAHRGHPPPLLSGRRPRGTGGTALPARGGPVIGEDGAAGRIDRHGAGPACAWMSSEQLTWRIRRRSHQCGTRF